jgi:hypothetical protein
VFVASIGKASKVAMFLIPGILQFNKVAASMKVLTNEKLHEFVSSLRIIFGPE